jgi:hypothetical protein
MPVLDRGRFLLLDIQFRGTRQRFYFIENDGLQANGNMVVVVPVQRDTFPAFSMPIAQSIRAWAFHNRRVGHQTPVFEDKAVILFFRPHP